jgi:hypothetical protein
MKNVIIEVPLIPILIFPMSLTCHYDLPKMKQKGCVTKGSDYDQRRSKRSDSVDAYIYWT